MINDGPKNEIYLEPGQTLAVRLTASDYGKVAVGMRSLNGGTVNYRLNGTDGSVSSPWICIMRQNLRTACS